MQVAKGGNVGEPTRGEVAISSILLQFNRLRLDLLEAGQQHRQPSDSHAYRKTASPKNQFRVSDSLDFIIVKILSIPIVLHDGSRIARDWIFGSCLSGRILDYCD